jgi:hypothetical protein
VSFPGKVFIIERLPVLSVLAVNCPGKVCIIGRLHVLSMLDKSESLKGEFQT